MDVYLFLVEIDLLALNNSPRKIMHDYICLPLTRTESAAAGQAAAILNVAHSSRTLVTFK